MLEANSSAHPTQSSSPDMVNVVVTCCSFGGSPKRSRASPEVSSEYEYLRTA